MVQLMQKKAKKKEKKSSRFEKQATTKAWAQTNASKIRLFLQSTMREYEKAMQVGEVLASCSQQ